MSLQLKQPVVCLKPTDEIEQQDPYRIHPHSGTKRTPFRLHDSQSDK